MSVPTNGNPDRIDPQPADDGTQHRTPSEKRCEDSIEQLTFTAKELAARLGISRAHVWKLLSLGQLPSPVRLGRAVRWDKRVIDAWLAAGAPAMAQWERTNTKTTRGES